MSYFDLHLKEFESLHNYYVYSSQSKDSLDWQAAFEVQQQKLLDLSAQVASLSSQNAALTALVSNCCRNNTLTVDIVRAQTLAILSQVELFSLYPL